MNRIYLIFETREDAKYAEEALSGKVLFCSGSSLQEIIIKPVDRHIVREILTNCGITFTMR